MSDAIKPLIAAAAERPLTRDEAARAFTILFEGEATPSQIGGFLMALRTRGETVDEYAAAAQVMRSKCHAVTAPDGAIDIVGTGGDGKGTLNISTATAFVVAGAGVPVAKHGNRNLSSKSGSADALTQMGVNVMVSADIVQEALAEAGIAFMMAGHPHDFQHPWPADQPGERETPADRRLQPRGDPPHGRNSGGPRLAKGVAGPWVGRDRRTDDHWRQLGFGAGGGWQHP